MNETKLELIASRMQGWIRTQEIKDKMQNLEHQTFVDVTIGKID
jgi:hypothetical protein